tara:strand:+ start:198 stop:815 length:618 start_codon:yes stop_codon:yes gene_type:complete
MSGTFTVSAGYQTVDFQSITNTRVTTSVSGVTQRIQTGGQFFSFKLKSPALTRAQAMADYSFFMKQLGQAESFVVTPPVVSSSRGTASGTITVQNVTSTSPLLSLAAGSKTIPVSGGTGTLLKGDLVKFSNHNKVYMVTEDCNLDGSTYDQLNISPGLTTALTGGGQTVTYDNVPFTVFLDTDVLKYITQADGTFKYEVVLNEEI